MGRPPNPVIHPAAYISRSLFHRGFVLQGAEAVNGLVNNIEVPADKENGKYVINYQQYTPGSKQGKAASMEVDYVIGSDGANSRVAKVRG